MVGTPWEMRLLGNYVLREKGGSVYGYISKISMIPEMKIGMCETSYTKVMKNSRLSVLP